MMNQEKKDAIIKFVATAIIVCLGIAIISVGFYVIYTAIKAAF
jgi:hypothetical protein